MIDERVCLVTIEVIEVHYLRRSKHRVSASPSAARSSTLVSPPARHSCSSSSTFLGKVGGGMRVGEEGGVREEW